MAKFNITNKAEKVVSYIFVATEKSPKKLRCDMVPEIRKQGLRILEDIVRANQLSANGAVATPQSRAEREALQNDCLSTIRVLDAFSEIALERNYFTSKQFNYLTQLSQELYDMILKWRASDRARQ